MEKAQQMLKESFVAPCDIKFKIEELLMVVSKGRLLKQQLQKKEMPNLPKTNKKDPKHGSKHSNSIKRQLTE